MTWQNPWGWLGLFTLALPVLIHLLGRGHSQVLRFPTLRFIESSRLLPTQRSRLHDLLLLALRLLVLLLAVAAGTQPLWRPVGARALDDATFRLVLIDSSASMQRLTPSGVSALTAARQQATELDSGRTTMRVIEVGSLRASLRGAVAVLQRQSGRGELVILSDFQAGSLDSSDVAQVPAAVGVSLRAIPLAHDTTSRTGRVWLGGTSATTTLSLDDSSTTLRWSSDRQIPAAPLLTVLASTDEAAEVDALMRAARSLGVPLSGDTTRATALLFPRAADREAVLQRARPVHTAWVRTIVARLRQDPLLSGSAGHVDSLTVGSSNALAIARDDSGAVAVSALEDRVNGHARLLLVVADPPASLLSASVVTATLRALDAAPLGEGEPMVIPASALARWNRSAGAVTTSHLQAGIAPTSSDGRWFWLAALLFLMVEWWLRRRTASVTEAPRAER